MEHNSIVDYCKGPKCRGCWCCKSDNSRVSHGMWARHLTVEDYQDLLDRGWRRSGIYCYKPLLSSTCCPRYTISCHATKFRISKSQKRCANAMTKYLAFGEDGQSAACSGGKVESASVMQKQETKSKTVRPGEGADPSKPPCRKAKVIRMERKAKRAKEASNTDNKIVLVAGKTATSIDTSSVPQGVCSDSDKDLPVPKAERKVDDIPDFLRSGKDGKKPLEHFLQPPESTDKPPVHRLEIKLVRSSPPCPEFKATFKESYALYKKYQMEVHNDKEEDCNEAFYTRFLCDSPLIAKKGKEGWPCDYGSYHQHYRIDGKLIAVGVIDILSKCISSVYVYFDMDYNFLTLGVYSALREIEMTRKLHLSDKENFKYYYMGYYVHSCPKLQYKGNYSPSYLLCPEKYVFMPIDTCLPKLDRAKYSQLCDVEKPPEDVSSWLGDTRILCQGTISTYGTLCQVAPKARQSEDKVKEYARLVGPQISRKMLLLLEL